jgi:predicted transglutaminase-like cysteine proteinase
MSRKQRVSYAAWNGLWHMFFPWVVGMTGDSPCYAPVRAKSRKNLRSLMMAGALGLSLAATPVWAENDYGDFVKTPTSQRQARKADKIAPSAPSAPSLNYVQQEEIIRPTEQNPLLILASVNSSTMSGLPQMNYPRLFGAAETRYDDLTAFTKWSGVLERFRDTFEANKHKRHTRLWMEFLKAATELDRADKIKAVNSYMNKIKFKDDKDNYGMNDYWATPMEFLARGGDCEDYAVAKYISLRALGFTDAEMRLAIVYDHEMRMPHAVLVIYEQNGTTLVLDNQTQDVKQAAKIKRYQPIYSINQVAWWRH